MSASSGRWKHVGGLDGGVEGYGLVVVRMAVVALPRGANGVLSSVLDYFMCLGL